MSGKVREWDGKASFDNKVSNAITGVEALLAVSRLPGGHQRLRHLAVLVWEMERNWKEAVEESLAHEGSGLTAYTFSARMSDAAYVFLPEHRREGGYRKLVHKVAFSCGGMSVIVETVGRDVLAALFAPYHNKVGAKNIGRWTNQKEALASRIFKVNRSCQDEGLAGCAAALRMSRSHADMQKVLADLDDCLDRVPDEGLLEVVCDLEEFLGTFRD